MTDTKFSDEVLVAYLDGELDSDTSASIAASVMTDETLKGRLDALRFSSDDLQKQAGQFFANTPELPTSLLKETSTGATINWLPLSGAIAASLAAGIFIGSAFLNSTAPTSESTWVMAIADYQELYVPETLAGVYQDKSELRGRLNRFSERHGITLAGVDSTETLSIRRAQNLGIDGRSLLQITFVSQSGEPVALCLVSVDEQDRSPDHQNYGDMSGISWVKDGMGYFVVGRVDETTLSAAINQWKL